MSAQSVSHAAMQPTHSPVWEELLLIEFRDDEVGEEGEYNRVEYHKLPFCMDALSSFSKW